MSRFLITIRRPGQRALHIDGLFPCASAADSFAIDQIGKGGRGSFSVKPAGARP